MKLIFGGMKEVFLNSPVGPDIDILLATYNGAKYVIQQLESIDRQQTDFSFRVIVSDDGSTDDTVELIKEYWAAIKNDRNVIYENEQGINRGVIKNFEFLLERSDSQYIMLSDQDDIWLPGKIDVSVKKLRELEEIYTGLSVLVHTDRLIVDQDLTVLNVSQMAEMNINEDLSLHESLLSNVAAGCTMVFNRRLIELALPFPSVLYMHDWWLFLVAKCYGVSYYLQESTLLYRQHGNNTLGGDARSRSFAAILKRMRIYFAHNTMNELYRICFSQATHLYGMRLGNKASAESNLSTVKEFVRGQEYRSWKLKAHVFRFRYLPRGYIGKLAVLINLR